MQIATSHFGQVTIEMDDVVHFPRGIVAFEDCRHWVLLSDAENPSLAWLQSVSRPEVTLPGTVSPRRFVPEYAVRLSRGQSAPNFPTPTRFLCSPSSARAMATSRST